MIIDDLTILVTLILAISLASERLVTIIKTLFPTWLADEKKTDALEVDLVRDKWRRFGVQVIAFLASWITAAFLNKEDFDLFGQIHFGTSENGKIHVMIVGLLASGGSAFWSNILGYTKAVKDLRVQQKAKENLEYHEEAKELGVVAYDGGVVAIKRRMNINSPQLQAAMSNISALTPPQSFDDITPLLNNRI